MGTAGCSWALTPRDCGSRCCGSCVLSSLPLGGFLHWLYGHARGFFQKMLKVTFCWIHIVTSSYCPCWNWVQVQTKPRQPESGVTEVVSDWSCHGPLFTGFVLVTQWDSEGLLELFHYENAGSPLVHLEQNHLGIFPSPNIALWRVLFETSLPALPSTDREPWISLGRK